MAELQDMPPSGGWECKIDERTGRYYYINHYTKTTTWEDPRSRHRPLQGTPKHFTSVQTEYIPLQHGSPDLRRNYVYPSQTSPIPAFQMPPHMSPKSVPLQDMRPRMSPLTVKSPKVQDSSLSALTDTDEAVAKISAMFPTVSETHIRLLLKNYRYMKSIFPEADETIILDILQNNDNNIQKTSEILQEIGYSKTDTVKAAQRKLDAKKEEERKEQEEIAKPRSPQIIRIKTAEEKKKMKADLQEKYQDVAEHLITIAMESVNFDETRANQILQIMIQEDTQAADTKKKEEEENHVDEVDATSIPTTSTLNLPVSQSRQSLKSLLKEKPDKEKSSFSRVIEEQDSSTLSKNLINTSGPNSTYAKGPNQKLLLEDYIKWQGSNTSIKKGPQGLAVGPNPNLLSQRTYQPCGPNLQLRVGPKYNRAKGSIFSQLKTVVVGESRGK